MNTERVVIPNFPDYTIDIYGNIINIKRNRVIKVHTIGRGYQKVILYNKNGKYTFPLHSLLCMVFKPIENMEDMTVDHIDGNCTNNSLDNLEWVSLKENIRRYWDKRNGTYNLSLSKPVIVYYLKDKKEVKYDNVIIAAKALKLHRYEVGRRLFNRFNFVFKDYTMIKWAVDPRPFDIPDDIEAARINCSHVLPIKAYNHITKEYAEFRNLQNAAKYTKVNISMLSDLLGKSESVIKYGWEFIRKTSNKSFSKPTIQEIVSFKYGKNTIYCIETNVKYNIKTFVNLEDASKFLNIKRTTLHYKLNYASKNPEANIISGWKVTTANGLSEEEASTLL